MEAQIRVVGKLDPETLAVLKMHNHRRIEYCPTCGKVITFGVCMPCEELNTDWNEYLNAVKQEYDAEDETSRRYEEMCKGGQDDEI